MIYLIDQRLQHTPRKESEPFLGSSIIFVGGFQQLPPVGDIPIYE